MQRYRRRIGAVGLGLLLSILAHKIIPDFAFTLGAIWMAVWCISCDADETANALRHN